MLAQVLLGRDISKLFSNYFDLGVAIIKTDDIIQTYQAGNDKRKSQTKETAMTHVKNNKTVSINTTTLKITVINHKRNTVYSVSPTEDFEHWEILVQQYFPNL